MAVTRIKNNQITDATITAAKIASQTLVGSLFATDLTLNSNLSIIGNLTITGTSSNINAVNTFISDPFVIFNNGYTGSLANYTIGMLLNRNLASLGDFGSVNTAWVWSEADTAFTGIATTDTGSGIVSINNAGYANIKIGNLSAVTAVTASSITATTLNLTNAVASTLVATNFSTGNAVISGGYISNLANATITTGNVASWYATTLNSTTGNITTLTATTINAGTTTSATLNATAGNITTLDTQTATSAILNATTGNITTLSTQTTTSTTLNATTGNITTLSAGTTTSAVLNATTGNITTLSAGTTTSAVLNATTGNITTLDAQTSTSTTLNATTGNITTLGAGTTTSATLNATTGNITTLDAGTTTSAVLNATTGNITTLSAGTTTSAVLNATTGNITTLDAGTTTSAIVNTTTANITSGRATTLVATNFSSGNAVITGGSVNASPIGNSTPSTGAFTTLTASGATTFTSATQSDTASTGAVVVTGGLGVGANLNVAGNVTVTGNLLVLGNTTTLNVETLNVEDLNITVAANATSGAEANGAGLTVAGANATLIYLNADDSWNLNKKLNATTVGAAVVNVTTANITTVDAITTTSTTLNSTTGNITTLTSTTVNAGTTTSATLNATTGNITTLGAGTTTSAVLNATTGNITTLDTQTTTSAILNATTGNITTLGAGTTTSATLNATTGNITTLDAGTTTSAVLNTTAANITGGVATTLVATNFSSGNAVITGGSINNTVIGNTTPANATVSLLKATGNIVAASGVNATNFTTGALVVPGGGGVGITGDLHVQGQSTFQGNINAGNIILSGNINVSVGAVQSSFGVFYGNAGGIGALYAGTSTYTALPATVLQMTGNVDTYAQVNFQNINTGSSASTDFVATADNGDDNDGYINVGINSSTFADPDYPGYYPNDGYLIHHGFEPATGNLNIHSHNAGSIIKFIVGGFGDANVRAAVTNTGLRVNTTTASSSTTSGALLVDGGTGIAGNINVGLGAIFNTSKAANYDFIVRGDNDDTLIWARPSSTYDSVVIGNSATTSTLVTGAKLIVNTTDSILLPAGSTAQRPGSTGGTDTAGMIRFNTSNAQLEFYDGAAWQNTGTDFTVIASETFDGDDNTTIFTLGAAATTQSVIVSLNGVLQIPTIAYSVSGTTLTFTSAPATGDKIEVRRLSTTATVSTFESSNGYVSFVATNLFANINAGTSSATNRMSFNTTGNVTVTANVAPSANVAYDLGDVNNWWKRIYVNSTVTGGADIAENYLADAVYNPGTVVEFGGEAEVTVSMTEASIRVAGVITSNPAHVMNGGLRGSTVASVALLGRVPCKVIGPVYKGDMLISAGYGFAKSCSSPVLGSVIGKAVGTFEGEKGSVEVVVGRL
jgi:hypothetical protein